MQELGEFVLPYDAVRSTPDPRAALLDFLETTYQAAARLARNAQDVEVFRAWREPDVIVSWSDQPEPTVGIEDLTTESIAFWGTFPAQQLDKRAYRSARRAQVSSS